MSIVKAKSLGRGYTVEEVSQHPALELLNQCNSYHNRIDLFGLTQLFLETTGNAFWLMKFDGYGIPVGLFLLPTQYMNPVRDSAGMVIAWRFGQGTNEVVYQPEDILHFKFPSLDDPYGMGHAPLAAAWNRVMLQFKEIGFLDANLSNFGRPDAILSPDEPISPTEAERLAKDFIHKFRGQGAGGVFVSDGPMKVTPISWPAKDFAELNLYATLKNSVSNVFHIPPGIWEIEEANRASDEAVLYALAVHCIKPRMARLIEKLNERLIPFYDDRLFFEAEAIVPEDKTFELQEMQTLLAAGVLTRNEVRIQYGYEPREWANEPLLPPGSMPASALEQEEEGPAATVPADEFAGQKPAGADSSNDLRATVGGSQQIMALQVAYYSGDLPRDACTNQARILFGFSPEEAEALFPQVKPEKLTPDDQPKQQGSGPEGTASPSGKSFRKALDLPDVRQQADYDCGPSACMSVCLFYGVGPEAEEDYIAALGATEEAGTDPEAIEAYLQQVGLTVEAGNDLEIADLAEYVQQGKPVICLIQDYEESPEQVAELEAGHYVVVCAADDDTVSLQDPSAGKVDMPAVEFLSRWQDRSGQKAKCEDDPECECNKADYVHYGIAVGRGQKCQEGTPKPGPCPKPGGDKPGGDKPKPAGDKPDKPKKPAGDKPKPAPKKDRPKVDDVVAQVQAMKDNPSPEQVKQLADTLSQMTVKDIHETKKKLGLKASGNKAELAQKVASRALAQPSPSGPKPVESSEPTQELLDQHKKIEAVEGATAALEHYTGNAYDRINKSKSLREGKPLQGYNQQAVEDISEAFAKAGDLQQPVVGFRGMNMPPEKVQAYLAGAEAAMKSGKPIYQNGYTSTSIDKNKALAFATGTFNEQQHENGAVMLSITTSKGLYVDPISENKGEKELLIDRQSAFKIKKIQTQEFTDLSGKKHSIKTIHMELAA